MVLESSFYQWTQRPLLALTALGFLHPLLASASCAIPIIFTATTATSPNAATMANIVSIVSVFIISLKPKRNIYNFMENIGLCSLNDKSIAKDILLL
jgi:hypothetical protein